MVLSMERWRGKVAIVTGASAGIGAAIAAKLVEEGLQVVGFARRAERVEEISKKLQDKKGKLHAVKVDITKEEDILRGFKWVSDNLGPVHILINNAGIGQNTNLTTNGNTEMWRKIIDTNVLGLCIGTREAVKIMKANNIDGHIIHINSLAGHKVIYLPTMSVYPGTKHAVTALTETLRQELNHLGLKIKVTSLSPGVVKTEVFEANGIELSSEWLEKMKLWPFLNPEDIAESVVYVLSTPPHVQVHELTIRPVGELI